MDQGVTFLNEPNDMSMPYELNNSYHSNKQMSLEEYTDHMNDNKRCTSGTCMMEHDVYNNGNNNGYIHHNNHRTRRNNNNVHNVHNDHNDHNDNHGASHNMSSCYDIYMHMRKCMICSSMMKREKYILYVLIVIAVLLAILVLIVCKKNILQ